MTSSYTTLLLAYIFAFYLMRQITEEQMISDAAFIGWTWDKESKAFQKTVPAKSLISRLNDDITAEVYTEIAQAADKFFAE